MNTNEIPLEVDEDFLPSGIVFALPSGEVITLEDYEASDNQAALLEKIKLTYLTRMDTLHEQLLVAAMGNPTVAERDTWADTLVCAQKALTGVMTPDVLSSLQPDAAERGQTVGEYAVGVVAKATYTRTVYGQAKAVRTRIKAGIKQAQHPQMVDGIVSAGEQGIGPLVAQVVYAAQQAAVAVVSQEAAKLTFEEQQEIAKPSFLARLFGRG